MRGLIAVLFVAFVLSITLLAFGATRAYELSLYWANPNIFAVPKPVADSGYDFSAITLTHPRNPADPLIGSFATHDGFLFFRGPYGLKSRRYADTIFMPGMTGLAALSDDRLIVPDAVPSFIVGNGRRSIYFIDSASGGRIYSATATGENLTRITEHAALNLAVIDHFLFYTNVEENHHLYRKNLNTEVHELVHAQPVYATLAHGSYLFFIAQEEGSDNTALYAWNLERFSRLRLSSNAVGGLRVWGDTLYYIDTNNRIQSTSFDGLVTNTLSPENVHIFDVFFQWIVFTEIGRHVPRAYNTNNNEFFTLSTTEWVSYIWTHDHQIYAIDHRNPSLVHNFELP
jgi:hypothetical protein